MAVAHSLIGELLAEAQRVKLEVNEKKTEYFVLARSRQD
jgi:hypothetical protein